MRSILVSPEKVVGILDRKDIAIIDCRYKLADEMAGFQEYKNGHIPGAFYAHMKNDLSSPVTPSSGRHPLPDFEKFCQKLSDWNITPKTHVIVYDQENGSMAATRLWWLLNYVGHSSAAILDGGYSRWIKMGFPVSTQLHNQNSLCQALYPCNVQKDMLVSTQFVLSSLEEKKYLLIDARSNDRFRGENETIDPVAGHIPGAVNRFHGNSLTANGDYRKPGDLKKELSDLISGHSIENTIVYCGSGITACNLIFAFAYSGTGMPKLYAGSWSEWIRDSTRPIVR
jgi:thiosulfate/3-mercaptopyruvate sulfurtransferase